MTSFYKNQVLTISPCFPITEIQVVYVFYYFSYVMLNDNILLLTKGTFNRIEGVLQKSELSMTLGENEPMIWPF